MLVARGVSFVVAVVFFSPHSSYVLLYLYYYNIAPRGRLHTRRRRRRSACNYIIAREPRENGGKFMWNNRQTAAAAVSDDNVCGRFRFHLLLATTVIPRMSTNLHWNASPRRDLSSPRVRCGGHNTHTDIFIYILLRIRYTRTYIHVIHILMYYVPTDEFRWTEIKGIFDI